MRIAGYTDCMVLKLRSVSVRIDLYDYISILACSVEGVVFLELVAR